MSRRRHLFPLVVLAAFVLVALLAGVLPLDAMTNHLDVRLRPPSAEHLLGTDDNGRDVLARLVLGARASLLVGFGAAALALLLGAVLGVAAGGLGSAVDLIVGRVLDASACLPPVFLAGAAAALARPSAGLLVVVLGIASFAPAARLARTETRRLMASEYVLAARAAGAGPLGILARHVLPGLTRPTLALLPVLAAGAVMGEAGLSFLGLGIPAPAPTWGQLLALIRTYPNAWWLAAFPGGALFALLLALNLVAEAPRPQAAVRLPGTRAPGAVIE